MRAKETETAGHEAKMRRLSFLACLFATRHALAQPQVATDSFEVTSRDDLVVDGGVLVGAPTALPTGLSRGVVAGVARGAIGARVAWSTATETDLAWRVTHGDLRLRVTAALQRAVGRGTFALRLGLGATIVHETRSRHHGARAGLVGDDLATSAFALLPAADLDAVIGLHVAGPWLVLMSGGPSLAVEDGARASWSAQLGVAWQR